MLRWIGTLAWLACVVYSTIPSYWLMIHPRIDYWRSRRRSPYRILVPLWILMWIIVGAITWPWRQVVLYTSAIPWMPGGLLIVTSMYLYRAAKTGFTGAQLGGRPELETAHWEQRLATEGIRARIRHPVYLAHLCEMMGWSIGSGLAACYALTLFAIVSGAFLLQAEDRELERRFGEPYSEYRRRVPAIFPRL